MTADESRAAILIERLVPGERVTSIGRNRLIAVIGPIEDGCGSYLTTILAWIFRGLAD